MRTLERLDARRTFLKTLSSFSYRAQQISVALLQVFLSRRMHRTRNRPPLPEKYLSQAEYLIKNHRAHASTNVRVNKQKRQTKHNPYFLLGEQT